MGLGLEWRCRGDITDPDSGSKFDILRFHFLSPSNVHARENESWTRQGMISKVTG